MFIEMLKEHGPHRIGQLVDHPHPGVADALVRRGIARPAVRTAAPPPPADPPKPKKVTRK